MGHTNEYTLLNEFLAGNETAYGQIYRLYSRDLYAFGLFLRAKPALIEDAIHDIFTEIYEKKDKLVNVRNLKLYLMGAFRNKLNTLSKQTSSYTAIADNELNVVDNDIDPLVEKENTREQAFLVEQLLSGLHPRQREVIYYRFMDGLSPDEIAAVMGINYQSVKNLIHRAVKKLRTMSVMGTANTFTQKKLPDQPVMIKSEHLQDGQ